MRPIGNMRMPSLQKGQERRVRILIDCTEGGPYGGVPAYDAHVIPSPYREGETDKIVCIESLYPGMCSRVQLPDGSILHKAKPDQIPVVVIWNYADQQLQVVDLSLGMWRTIDRWTKDADYGDPRGFDAKIVAEEGDGRIAKKRVLMPTLEKGPLSTEIQHYVAQNLEKAVNEMCPNVTAEEMAAFVQGDILPEGSTGTPSLTPSPLGEVPSSGLHMDTGGIPTPEAGASAPPEPESTEGKTLNPLTGVWED
jgi:hypothetical protein